MAFDTRPGERGVSLVALMVAITLMMIAMAIMLPAWTYVVKNEREQELLFRGEQIARAIEKYQAKTKGLPTSLEVLVKGRYLRKAYKDPMTKNGEWRFMHPGEPPIPEADLKAAGGHWARSTRTIGPINGVASRNPSESLRFFNSRRRYNEWFFYAGQPRVIGKIQRLPPGAGNAGQPGAGGQSTLGARPTSGRR